MKRFLDAIAQIWRPHPGQLEFLTAEAKFKVLACGRRWGKTDACAVRILHDVCQAKPSRSLILAPTLDQARLLFDRVVDLFERLLERWPFKTAPPEGKPRRTPYPSIKLGRHIVSARSGHLVRALRGNEADHIVVDEAAYVPEELVAEVAMPMLATTKGALTLISTPRGLNHFWRFFKMGQEGRHGIWSRRAPSSESPYVSRTFLEVQRELISERAFETEYEAGFQDSECQVFKTEAVDDALRTEIEWDANEPICIGVDWGKYTDFTTVAVVAGSRADARLIECHRFNRMPWKAMVERVAEIAGRFTAARVLCDGAGVGDPLIEGLLDKAPYAGIEAYPFTNASKALLVDNLAWMFENRAIAMVPHPELMRELAHFESSATASGLTRFGAQGGFHDDLVIALALACHLVPHSTGATVEVGPERRFAFSQTPIQGDRN